MVSGILAGYLTTFRTILYDPAHRAAYLGLIIMKFLMRGYTVRHLRHAVALMDYSAERQELLLRLKKIRKVGKLMHHCDVLEVLARIKERLSLSKDRQPLGGRLFYYSYF